MIKEMAFNKSDNAKDLRKLDSDRARTRRKVRNVTVLALAVITLGLTSVSYTDWYRTAPGQLGLTVVGLMVAGSLVWMRKTARNKPEPHRRAALRRPRRRVSARAPHVDQLQPVADLAGQPGTRPRSYHQQVGYVLHVKDRVLTPAQAAQRVAAYGAWGSPSIDGDPFGGGRPHTVYPVNWPGV
ncbi:hypothetical protein STRAU_1768 [Streptomyces aurantiacus JA 4570]|uniref:Uncharacterized protein n=1 Tax=Streptomyces aurantiacus JA 4570 TaxID=1286094 RepID=S4A364_9ACTN|nr:hypothetical protein STRAU_1768 [Streptomyces aurantiacus JA 4570]